MNIKTLFSSLLLLTAGCITNGEHERLMNEAKAACDAEMAKQQAASKAEVGKRDQRIAKLESDLDKLGIDMKQTEAEMSGKLASTQAQLEQLKKQQERAERDAATFRSVAEKLKA